MIITFIQSADCDRYSAFFEVTSRTVRAYCRRYCFHFESFLGLKRGNRPWHAALNRIAMLKALIDSGQSGWVIHLDADAFIADLDFDLPAFLSDKSGMALIAAPSGVKPPRWWDINNGVFMINLSHELGREIVERWYSALEAIPEANLTTERRWGDVVDDQALMHTVLKDIPHVESYMWSDIGWTTINFNGSFIKQVIRTNATMAERLNTLHLAVDAIIGKDAGRYDREALTGHERFAAALYRALLSREPDAGGMASVMWQLRNGDPYETIIRQCLESPEFKSKLGTFVDRYAHTGEARQ